jgi:hypothetical protein
MLGCNLNWFRHTQYPENKLLNIPNNPVRCCKPTCGISYPNRWQHTNTVHCSPRHHIPSRVLAQLEFQTRHLQITTNTQTILPIANEGQRTVSLEAHSAIAALMPLDQAISLYNDIRAVSKGQPTNAVAAQLKKLKPPSKREEFNRLTATYTSNWQQWKVTSSGHLYRRLQNRTSRRNKHGSGRKLQRNP